MARDNLSAVRN